MNKVFLNIYSFQHNLVPSNLERGSEFSSYKIELLNQVTQSGLTNQVSNSNTLTDILRSSY